MPSAEVLKPHFESAVTVLYDRLVNNLRLRRYFKSEQQVRDLKTAQVQNLLMCLEDDEENIKKRYMRIGKIHFDMELPVTDFIESLEFMHGEMIESMHREQLGGEYFEYVHRLFGLLKQSMSKGYFIRECHKLASYYTGELAGTIYFRVHIKWMVDLIGYFSDEAGNIRLPNADYENKVFTKLLDLPETGLIIKNRECLEDIHRVNEKLTEMVKAILYQIRRFAYYEALVLLRFMVTESFHIMYVMNREILVHYSSREEGFFAYIKLMVQEGREGHLSIINIRKLGMINKYRGVDKGDRILSDMENWIKSYIVGLDEDIVFIRASNGEFYIYYPDMDEEYLKIIQKSLKNFLENQNYDLGEIHVRIKTAFASIQLHKEIEINFVEKLLHYTLMRAKESDEGLYYLTSTEEKDAIELIRSSKENIDFVNEALMQEKLEIFFQPIIDLTTHEVYDVEVLARIKSGEVYISAGSFINLIYELDVIVELDTEILKKVIEYAPKIRKLTQNVFINVSPQSLRSLRYQEVMVESVNYLSRDGIRVHFELTEQSFISNIELITQIHQKYAVKFAVDDFGTGFSSLKTVAELAESKVIDYIKIDGSIVKNITTSQETYQILDATSYMTRKLNLINIAEFIENEEIMQMVKELGIRYGQGFYFSKPMLIDELLEHRIMLPGQAP